MHSLGISVVGPLTVGYPNARGGHHRAALARGVESPVTPTTLVIIRIIHPAVERNEENELLETLVLVLVPPIIP